jgi:hypothetical protein
LRDALEHAPCYSSREVCRWFTASLRLLQLSAQGRAYRAARAQGRADDARTVRVSDSARRPGVRKPVAIAAGRNPAAALIPVRLTVEAIDLAPLEIEAIRTLADAVEEAIDDKDYAAARAILQNLVSEIRIRTYSTTSSSIASRRA